MGKLNIARGVPLIIVGGAWGDEGKGKFVDILSEEADFIIRANGGANAGHTVCIGDKRYDFHLVPSGVLYPNKTNILASGVAFNPIYFQKEVEKLSSLGIKADSCLISEKANLVLPFHIILDELEEESKKKSGTAIGTTKQGIGPANTDGIKRIGLRAYHLTDKDLFLKDLKTLLEFHRQSLKGKIPKEFQPEFYEGFIKEAVGFYQGKIVNTEEVIAKGLKDKKRLLVEGAQGTLLDLRHGTYPKVTTSNTTSGGLAQAAGIPRSVAVESIGIFKAYTTRVGAGGMPTELPMGNMLGDTIRDKAHEYGVTTGRPRRIGYFDGVAARYSNFLNRFKGIVISCADVVCDLDPKLGPLKICREYKIRGQKTDRFPWVNELLAEAEAVYGEKDEYGPVKGDISKVKKFEDLPKELQRYSKAIASTMEGAELLALGNGRDRDNLIVL